MFNDSAGELGSASFSLLGASNCCRLLFFLAHLPHVQYLWRSAVEVFSDSTPLPTLSGHFQIIVFLDLQYV